MLAFFRRSSFSSPFTAGASQLWLDEIIEAGHGRLLSKFNTGIATGCVSRDARPSDRNEVRAYVGRVAARDSFGPPGTNGVARFSQEFARVPYDFSNRASLNEMVSPIPDGVRFRTLTDPPNPCGGDELSDIPVIFLSAFEAAGIWLLGIGRAVGTPGAVYSTFSEPRPGAEWESAFFTQERFGNRRRLGRAVGISIILVL